jgi:putative glutamine amidotransferase
MEEMDGLLVTGGAFDVDPALWGGGAPHPKVTLKPGRTDFEMAAVRAALAADKPVLGICGGQQLLAVAFGGTLIQHIPDEVAGALPHEQPNPRTEPGHEVAIAPGTLLSRIVGTEPMRVNSAHHQAVATAGAGALVNAVAPDGVVEGVEHPGHRFALGVQWHPEYAVDPRDPAIFAAFVGACR